MKRTKKRVPKKQAEIVLFAMKMTGKTEKRVQKINNRKNWQKQKPVWIIGITVVQKYNVTRSY